MTADSQISDEEIRDWARATGREVGSKGRIAAALRAEYEQLAAEADAHPPADPGQPPSEEDGRGPESDSKDPGPAAEETRPRRVRSTGSRVRARLLGGSGKKRPSRSRAHARVPVEKLITRGWETASRILTPVNLPVARCLDWQAPTAGALLEEAVRDTVVDKLLQPVARAEDKLEIAGALIGPPLLVFALQLPNNQPVRQAEVTGPDGTVSVQTVPWPAGAMRQQVLMTALVEALDMCVEAQEKLPAEVLQRQRQREERRAALQALVKDVFFAQPPGDAEAAAAEEEAMARARERFRGV